MLEEQIARMTVVATMNSSQMLVTDVVNVAADDFGYLPQQKKLVANPAVELQIKVQLRMKKLPLLHTSAQFQVLMTTTVRGTQQI